MKNFAKFLEENNLKKSEVADYLGVSKQYISQVASGASVLSEEKLTLLAKNTAWETGMLSEELSKVSKKSSAARKRQDKAAKSIPLLPFDAVAGYMSDNNGVDSFRGEAVTFSDFTERGADCVIRVDGDSMYPKYNSGDVLAIKILKDPTFFQWGKVYCISTVQGCIVKRLFPFPGDAERIICHSENWEKFPDYTISKSDVLAVAIVVGHAGVE